MVGNIQAGCVALLPLFTAWCMREGKLFAALLPRGLWQESSSENLRVRHCSQLVSELETDAGCSAANHGEVFVQNVICGVQ